MRGKVRWTDRKCGAIENIGACLISPLISNPGKSDVKEGEIWQDS
jgi:hypothetical protein